MKLPILSTPFLDVVVQAVLFAPFNHFVKQFDKVFVLLCVFLFDRAHHRREFEVPSLSVEFVTLQPPTEAFGCKHLEVFPIVRNGNKLALPIWSTFEDLWLTKCNLVGVEVCVRYDGHCFFCYTHTKSQNDFLPLVIIKGEWALARTK